MDIPENGGDCEVAPVPGIAGGHHVLSIEHLLSQFGNGERAVLLRAAWRQRSETGHEEMETREGDHVHGKFPQIGVQLAGEPETGRIHELVMESDRFLGLFTRTWARSHVSLSWQMDGTGKPKKYRKLLFSVCYEYKPETSGDTRHGKWYEMVEVTVRGGRQFQCTETDVVKSFVVYAIGFVRVFNQLVDWQRGVIRFDNCIGNLNDEIFQLVSVLALENSIFLKE